MVETLYRTSREFLGESHTQTECNQRPSDIVNNEPMFVTVTLMLNVSTPTIKSNTYIHVTIGLRAPTIYMYVYRPMYVVH